MNVFVDRRRGARGALPAGATHRFNRAVAGPLQLLLGSRLHGRAALASVLARLGAGVVFVSFSIGKFARHGPEAESFERYGIPFPDALTYVVGVLELGGGLLLDPGAPDPARRPWARGELGGGHRDRRPD